VNGGGASVLLNRAELITNRVAGIFSGTASRPDLPLAANAF
jgi:hypothetical protein